MNNNFIFVGRICKNLELRYTKENKALVEMSLAINNTKESTTFVKVSVWGKIAETTAEYCKKGDLIGVQGKVLNHNWEDDKGNKHYDYNFMANNVTFLQTKSNDEDREKQQENDTKKATDEQIYADFGSSIEITDDDIAF